MSLSRRPILKDTKPQNTTNASLWFDKYLTEQVERRQDSETSPAKDTLINEVTDLYADAEYRPHFERWQNTLTASGIMCKKATTTGRMVVGLGGESAIETAITLHRTYGVPYIPGSALKGLAAMYARTKLEDKAWHLPKEDAKEQENAKDAQTENSADQQGWAYNVLFGTTQEAGHVTFFDALYVPNTGHAKRPLHKDVLTVHHKEYYDGTDKPPADWDSPVIIPFLSATGTYLLALDGPAEWVEKAYKILEKALAEDGIGAKTSSGYGRMRIA